MAKLNPLDWQNENSLSNYPFTEKQDIQDFIVDASFIQFDNYTPILNSVVVADDRLRISMTFDYGTDETIVFMRSAYNQGEQYRQLRIYTPDKDRYLGVLVFGEALADLWQKALGATLKFKGSFLPELSKSIPSNAAVYSFDGNYGDVTLGRASTDSAIFYNTSLSLNAITCNAVQNHAVPENSVKEGLRKINLVPPLNNNINLVSNDVVKIKAFNGASLTIELVSGASSSSFVIPTLIS